jgi:DNA-directed RNA polymerase subunit M/transcription elongation factor TFIIS
MTEEIIEKKCNTCLLTKPRNENYTRNKRMKDGYSIKCKQCEREYREKNKDKVRLSQRKYIEKNRKLVNKKHREYIKKNIENI